VAQDAFDVPPIPVHLASFATMGGMVVPYITLRHRNGTAALGLVDYSRMVRCFEGHRCGVCGEVVTGRMVFLMRSFDLARSLSSEPGLCPPCAAYTVATCPMSAGRMAHYRQSRPAFVGRRCDDPECECSQWVSTPEPNRYGATAEQWFAPWTVQYRLIRDEHGRLAAGFRACRPPAPAATGSPTSATPAAAWRPPGRWPRTRSAPPPQAAPAPQRSARRHRDTS
jgi:hypothetical protein